MVIGYIEAVENPRTIISKATGKSYEIFKFILNNNDGCKIQCNVWNKDIEIFEDKIKYNKVILI